MSLDWREWGLFDENQNPVIPADLVAGIEFQSDAHISNYPQQDGAFASYNKVQIPNAFKLTFFVGGSDEARADVLDAADTAKRSLKTYIVGMPEYSFPSVNVTHFGARREARQGVKLLRLEIWGEEVRILGRSYLRQSRSSNGEPTKAQGNIQSTELKNYNNYIPPAGVQPPT